MKLPDPVLLGVLEPHFPAHRCWHVSRLEFNEELRLRFPAECGTKLHSLAEPESGCDFLLFHRRMIRHFKWTIATTRGVTYRYDPWTGPRVPAVIEDLLRATSFDLDTAYRRIPQLVATGTLDELGGFIEANKPGAKLPGSGIHNAIHRAIGRWEEQTRPDPSADMRDMRTAPANEFFWKLHGWIDEIYAGWQRAHGQAVEQDPAPMDHPHVQCDPLAPSFPADA